MFQWFLALRRPRLRIDEFIVIMAVFSFFDTGIVIAKLKQCHV